MLSDVKKTDYLWFGVGRINPLVLGVPLALAPAKAVPPAIPVPELFWRHAAGGTPIDL